MLGGIRGKAEISQTEKGKLAASLTNHARIRFHTMHRPSLQDAIERARSLCSEALVRLDSPDDVHEDGASRLTWIQSTIWNAYSELTAAHVELPEDRKRGAGLTEVNEETLRQQVEAAERAAEAAAAATAGWLESTRRGGDDSAQASTASHQATLDLAALLWHAHEITLSIKATA